MIIANLRNKRDYLKAVQYQNELINISIQNDLNIAKARQSQKGGKTDEAPKPIEDQYTKDEILLNQNKQLEVAKKLLGDLGFNYEETSTLLSSMTQDQMIILISSFPNIKKQISERYNMKFLTPTFFMEWFQKYCDNFESAKGLTFGEPENVESGRFRRGAQTKLINKIVSQQGQEAYEKKFTAPIREKEKRQQRERTFRGEEINFDYEDDLENEEGYTETPYGFKGQPQKEASATAFNALTDNIGAILDTLPTPDQIDQVISDIQNTSGDHFSRRLGNDPNEIKQYFTQLLTDLNAFIYYVNSKRQLLETNSGESQAIRNYLQNIIRDLPTPKDLIFIHQNIDKTPMKQIELLERYVENINVEKFQDLAKIINATFQPVQATASFDDPNLQIATATTLQPTDILDLLGQGNSIMEFDEFNKLSPDDMLTTLKFYKEKGYGGKKISDTKQYTDEELILKFKNSRAGIVDKFNTESARILQFQKQQGKAKSKQEGKEGVGFRRNNKIGRGLNLVQEEPKYKAFGKYIIHWGQLNNNDILNVKYACMGNIPSLKPSAISDVFKEFIIDILETGKLNERMYKQIPNEEKKIFEKMVMGAGLMNQLKLKRVYIDQELEDIKKFNILKGEYLAGNDNDKLKKELRRYVVQFMNDNRISKNEGTRLLMELSF